MRGMNAGGTRRKWSRGELVPVLNLYHKLAFGQFYHRNKATGELFSGAVSG